MNRGRSPNPGRGEAPTSRGRRSPEKYVPNNAHPTTMQDAVYTQRASLSVVRAASPDRNVLTDIALRAHGFGTLLDGLVAHPEMLSDPCLLDQVLETAQRIADRTRQAVAA